MASYVGEGLAGGTGSAVNASLIQTDANRERWMDAVAVRRAPTPPCSLRKLERAIGMIDLRKG